MARRVPESEALQRLRAGAGDRAFQDLSIRYIIVVLVATYVGLS